MDEVLYPPSIDPTIVSQYATGQRIRSLLLAVKDELNPRANLERFYNLVWNVDTAQGYGLDVWGRIVVVSRVLTITTGVFLAFQEASGKMSGAPFGKAPFYTGVVPAPVNYTLDDDVYRLLILAKAAFNVTDGSIPAINAILMGLFPDRGNCYVTDGENVSGSTYFGFAEAGGLRIAPFNAAPFAPSGASRPDVMSLVYVFEFPLQPFEYAIVTQSGVLPKPVGVSASVSVPP